MDFLDPKAKKRHAIRMMIGYGLMGLLIAIATTILVFQAYGFDVDRKTGEVIQNGLVFVDSAPSGASVYLNDKLQKDQTNVRQTLPEGHYNLLIRKDGYRDWRRSFDLKGGSIERFTYPLLLPNELVPQEVVAYDQTPAFTTESLDRRYVLVSTGASLTNYIEYDLNNLTKDRPAERQVTFPAGLFTAADGAHGLELVEWSTDNKHLLVKHTFNGGKEFIILSRDAPETSININKLLVQTPTTVTLRDKKFDQWYLFNAEGGLLQTADAKKTITPVLSGIGVFKSHDAETLLYTQPVVNSTNQRVFLRQGKQTYMIREITAGTAMLDLTQYDNAWYVVIGSDADKKTYVYKDPVKFFENNKDKKPAPLVILHTTGPLTNVSFSQNTRFIVAQSGQHFEVYDAEYKQSYKYDISQVFDPSSKVTWMDGHRMLGRSGGKIIMFDFEGSNFQTIIPSSATSLPMFDRDYTVLYTLNTASSNKDKQALFRTDLRYAQDR